MIPRGFEQYDPELVPELISYLDRKCTMANNPTSLDYAICQFRQVYPTSTEQKILLNGKSSIGASANGIIIDSGVLTLGEQQIPIISKYPKKPNPDFFYEVFVTIKLINECIQEGITGLVPSYGFFLCSPDKPLGQHFCTSDTDTTLFLITHKLNGMTMYDYMERHGATITIDKINEIIANLFSTLIQLEECEFHIIHNDLHIWNIMMQGDYPYLLDFGACSFTYGTYQYTLCDWVRGYTRVKKVEQNTKDRSTCGGAFDIIKVISRIIMILTEKRNDTVSRYLQEKQDAILSQFRLVPFTKSYIAPQGIELYKWLLNSGRSGDNKSRDTYEYNYSQLQHFTYRRIKDTFFHHLPEPRPFISWIPDVMIEHIQPEPISDQVREELIDNYAISSTEIQKETLEGNRDTTTIVLFAGLFSDGSGDFSFTSNVIQLLLENGISPNRIHVVLMPLFGKIGLQALQNMHREVLQCVASPTGGKTPNPIGEQVFTLVRQFFTYICTTYNYLFTKENCDESQSIMDLPSHEIRRVLQQFLQEQPLYKLRSNSHCDFTAQTLQHFITYTVEEHVIQWLKNCVAFFFTNPMIPIEQFHVQVMGEETIPFTPSMLAPDTQNVLTISFLNVDKYIDPTWERFTRLSLEEGGYCTKKFAPGFSKINTETCIGITVIDVEQIKINIDRKQIRPFNDGNYMVCYFGNIRTTGVSSYNLLCYFKLKSVCELMFRQYPTAIICINKAAFTILSFPEAKQVFPSLELVTDGNMSYYMIHDMKVTFFERKEREDFLVYLYQSLPVCVVTGDQSYFEGISMGKIVLYDLLGHKIALAIQMLELYQYIFTPSRSNTIRINQMVQNTTITRKMYHQNKTFMNRQQTYECKEDYFIYETTDTNTSEIIHTEVRYQAIKAYYQFIYHLCLPLLEPTRHTYFLREIKKYSFTAHLQELLLQQKVVHLGKKKSKRRYKKQRSNKKQRTNKNIK